jgi:hypothetical protein
LNRPKDLKTPTSRWGFLFYFVLSKITRIFIHMKKVTFIFALGVMFTLAACGSGSTATETTDSTAVQADTATVATDSTTASVDSTAK